jgi:hypothetical protein
MLLDIDHHAEKSTFLSFTPADFSQVLEDK